MRQLACVTRLSSPSSRRCTKHVQSAVAEGDAEKAQAALKTVTKRLDMAAAKHVIHKNQASNRKSGLAKLVNSINA